jgi:peptidoglycan/LPS O-acetylase OafA/YrhL
MTAIETLNEPVPTSLPLGPLGHVPTLDGLRGIAVSAVFAVHLYAPIFGGGGWGVDLFFVLSGFLITKLLYEEYDRVGAVDLRAFYSRRFFRLQPAMAVLLLSAWITSYTTFEPDGDLIRRQVAYTGLLSGNLWALGEGFADRPVLGHTWSLGLEEQFYLVWPLLLAFLPAVAFAHPRRFLKIVAVFTAASIVVGRVVVKGLLDYPHWGSIPFFNIDGLAMGCVLAVYLHTHQGLTHRVRPWLLALSIAIPAVDLFAGGRYLDRDEFGIRTIVLRLAFTYIVFAAVTQPRYRPLSILRNAQLAFLGMISYSLYLWHIPVIQFFDESRFPTAGKAVLGIAKVVVSLAVACGSFFLVERPVLAWYRRRRKRRLEALSAT